MKESKLKKILSYIPAIALGSGIGGALCYFNTSPNTLNLSHEKYTTLGVICGGIIGAYAYYSRRSKFKE